MLYRVTEKKMLVEHPEISQIEELASLPDNILKWIFLVYDWEGPYRKIPLEKRREIVAIKNLFSENRRTKFDKYVEKMLKGEVSEVNQGIAAFKEQQYDEDRETLESLKECIRDLRNMMKKEAKDFKDAKAKAELAKKLREMAEEQKKLEELFQFRDGVDQEDDVERSASILDEFMENEGRNDEN
jgi:transcription elongation factor GreA-like protein